MKVIIQLLIFFKLTVCCYAEAYVLDKKESSVLGGTTLIMKSDFYTETDVAIKQQDEVSKRKLKGGEKSKKSVKYISKNEIVETLISIEESSEMEVGGKALPAKVTNEHVLKGVPLKFIHKNDVWLHDSEGVNFSEEQSKKIKSLLEDKNTKANSLYGYEPRSVGDKWKVPLLALGEIVGGESLKGKAQIEFLSVKTVAGVVVAELVVNFNISGLNERGQSQQAEGTVSISRDLSVFLDLRYESKVLMSLNKNKPSARIVAEGSLKALSTIEVIKGKK